MTASGKARLLGLACVAVGAGCDTLVGVDDTRGEVFGSGVVVTEVRALPPFSGIRASGGYQVVVEQGVEWAVEITTDDNLLRVLQTDVFEGVLLIGPVPVVKMLPTEPLIVRVRARELSYLAARGATTIEADVGAVPELRVELSAASVAWVSGAAERQIVSMSGASIYHGFGVASRTSMVMASGASLAELDVRSSLQVTASGASLVRYRGTPRLTHSLTGASVVQSVP